MGLGPSRVVFVDRVLSTLAEGVVVRQADELVAHDLAGDRYLIPENTNRSYLFEWICGVVELVSGESVVRTPPPDRVGA